MNRMTIVLKNVPYWMHPEPLAHLPPWISFNSPKPVTLISSADGTLKSNDITDVTKDWHKSDDVWSEAFAELAVLQTPFGVEPNANRGIIHIQAKEGKEMLPSGPYFLHGSNVHQAWRLYPDEFDAFIAPVVPDSVLGKLPKTYSTLNLLSDDGSKVIAVPSRMYQCPSQKQPLEGKRVSVKDNIDLAGVKTTLMNKAFAEFSDVAGDNAAYIHKLETLGAVIVGKTKLCSFAGSDEPTDQWVDYHCPFNPRGDLYQSPSGSTTGGGVALAGYPWLDYSIGTDTTGSIRAAASCVGVYALRSSFGSSKMDGIYKACRDYDVVGLMGRDLESFYDLAKTTLDLKEPIEFPKRILYPTDFFPHSNNNQQAMVDDLAKVLKLYLEVELEEFSFSERWAECPPPAAQLPDRVVPLKEFLDKSAFWPMYYDFYHNYDKFRDEYRKEKHRDPYVGPIIRFRWHLGKDIKPEQQEEGRKKLEIFRTWFQENVMRTDERTLSDAVLIMPNGRAVPKYRDDHNGPPGVVPSFSENYVASILQLPQLILPIGQNAYDSRISGVEEHRPIVGSFVGARGSDLMLIRLAQRAFEKAQWHTKVQTGRYTFPLSKGKNSRNVADQSNVETDENGSAETKNVNSVL